MAPREIAASREATTWMSSSRRWRVSRQASPFPLSPYDHDGRINDRLVRGLLRQTSERGVEGRVPLLAYKLAGTQGCLPGFEVFSLRSRGGIIS